MIKINLATRKQASITAESKSGKFGLGNLNLDQLKELPLRQAGVALLACLVGGFFLDTFKEDQLKRFDAVFLKLNAEQTRLKTELAKTNDFERLKKSLDGDEFTIKTKIETIRKLVADRGLPPKLLMGLSSSIPEEVWIQSFKLENTEISLKGAAVGFNQITDFMKSVNENAYFTELRLNGSQQSKDPITGVETATFDISAKRRQ